MLVTSEQKIIIKPQFFRLPVPKLATKLHDPYMPTRFYDNFNLSQRSMVSGLEGHRFWVHISARRTGKSVGAAMLALAKLLEPNQQVMIIAPNYALSSIIWEYVKSFIEQLGLETKKKNEKDKVVVLSNDSVFRLLSANNRESLVGRGANFLIIDEAALIQDNEYFERDLRPALSTYSDSRALFISTPRGKANYLYDYYLRGNVNHIEYPEWGSGLFDWTSNPILSQEDIDEARKSTTSQKYFLQEYYCEWTVFEGQIFSMDEDKHLQDLSYIQAKDPTFDFIAGLDMGYRDETAFIVIATDGEKYYIVDEYVTKETPTPVMAEKIKEMQEEWGIDNIYIDSASAQAKADLAYEYDIYCDNAIKSVNDGIAHIQGLVEKDKLICDLSNAQRCFTALSGYHWKDKIETQKPVHDEHSHPCDAIRYAIYSHQKNSVGIYAG